MNIALKISMLAEQYGKQVEVLQRKKILGLFPSTLHIGWLWIEDKGTYWYVTFASGKDCHNTLNGPAIGADFLKESGERRVGPLGLSGAWESALSMWPIKEEAKAISVFTRISSLIDVTFRFHRGGVVSN